MKREMTPELQKKLAGLLPVSQDKGVGFTPSLFTKELKDFAPIFYVRPWTVDEQNSYSSEIQKAQGNDNFDDLVKKFTHMCVVKVENLFDLNGEPIKDMDFEVFCNLPIRVLLEVFDRVQRISGIVKEEAEGLE